MTWMELVNGIPQDSGPTDADIKNGGIVNLYAECWADPKYAVQIYQIDNGITFGPAMGKDYNSDGQHHDVDEETKLQFEGDDDPNHHNIIKDSGKDKRGNDYRCIHYDNWKTIIYWNKMDPHVYDQCESNGCTHSVNLSQENNSIFNENYRVPDMDFGSLVADGSGILTGNGGSLAKNPVWNQNSEGQLSYANSDIRTFLNGDGKGSDSLLETFPAVLQEAIGRTKISDAGGTVNDKLWLPSAEEIQKFQNNKCYDDNAQEGKFWTRSVADAGKTVQIYDGTTGTLTKASPNDPAVGVSPCFTLSGNGTGEGSPSGSSGETSESSTEETGTDTPETSESETTHTYTTKEGQWTPDKDKRSSVWHMKKTEDGSSDTTDVTLESSKDAQGRTVWTYTFNVEDDTQTYYVYEKMNEPGVESAEDDESTEEGEDDDEDEYDTGLLEGYSSLGSDGRQALKLMPGIVDSKTHSYTIVNSYSPGMDPYDDYNVGTGSLKLTKHVDGTMQDPQQTFQFNITLSKAEDGSEDEPGGDSEENEDPLEGTQTQIFGNIIFQDGKAKVGLKNGESVVMTGIPAGLQYQITEEEIPGYSATSENAEGTITSNSEIESVWTNRVIRAPEEPPEPSSETKTNSWSLKKTVDGAPGKDTDYRFLISMGGLDKNQTYGITDSKGNYRQWFKADSTGHADVDVTLKAGEMVTFKDVPVDSTYQVMEYAGANYIASYTVENEPNPDGTDAAGQSSIASVRGSNTEKNKNLPTGIETVDEGENITITFNNRYPAEQSLKIEEHMGRPEGGYDENDTTREFYVTVRFFNIPQGTVIESPEAGNVTPDSSGEASKNIKMKTDGIPLSFTGIPAGVRYQVTQEACQEAGEASSGSFKYTPRFSISVYDSTGQSIKGIVTKPQFEGNQNAELSTAEETLETNANDQVVFVNVKATPPLPETGGTGTGIFYIIGGALMAAAVALAERKRRRCEDSRRP